MKKLSHIILFNRNVLILIIATVGMLPELISFGGYYICGDITTQILPFVYETKRMIASGLPFWSWNTYFGDNFMASYAYYTVFNPFTWINCLFPYKYLGVGFTLVLYLKFLVCGYVAQLYLKKIGFGEKLSLIGSLLYTFSSWAITNLCFYMFMEPMILFPFLLLFVERFLAKERHAYSGLAMAVFVVVAVNYYFAAVNLITATIYFFCRMLFLYNDGRERLWFTIKAAGCVWLGIICASVVVIPLLMQLKGSPHESFTLDTSDVPKYFDRIMWLLYPKAHEGKFCYILMDSRWNSNSASIAVFGLLPALLLFTKKGYGWIKWLIAVFILAYLTPLNGLFSLFTNMYYTRWAYALTLAIIVGTLYYLKDYDLPRMKSALWYCAVVYGAFFLFTGASIYWQYLHAGDMAIPRIFKLGMYVVLIAVNAIVLLLLCYGSAGKKIRYTATVTAVAVCTALQFVIFSLNGMRVLPSEDFFLTETEYFTNGDNYREDGDLKYRSSFTVMNSGSWPVSNFGLICNRPSIGMYHSVQNCRIQKWESIVSDTILPSRMFKLKNFVKSFEALMSVKDLVVISDGPTDTILSLPIAEEGLFTVYESDHYIPMGFTYDRYILSDSVESLAQNDSETDIPKALLSLLSIDKEDESELSLYMRKGSIDDNLCLDSLVAVRRTVTCDSFTGHNRGFDAHIALDSAAVVFFSVLADDGFNAYIDNQPTKIYDTNLGFSSVIVPAGNHYITFRYFPPGLKLGMMISVIGLSITVLMFRKRL